MIPTIEDVRKEITKIDPELLSRYTLESLNTESDPNNLGVRISSPNGTTIVIYYHTLSDFGSYGAKEGLFQIMPLYKGKDLESIFGDNVENVKGNLTLNDAIEIAEGFEGNGRYRFDELFENSLVVRKFFSHDYYPDDDI